jgi:hypothetical protein
MAQILEDKVILNGKQPYAEVVIIDGSALVNFIHQKIPKTFKDYATLSFVPKVQSYSSKYKRIDLIFDVYKS